MKHLITAAAVLALTASTAMASDVVKTTKKKAVPEATVKDVKKPAPIECFKSFDNFLNTDANDCPISTSGITLYGTVDMGIGYNSHAVPFNKNYPGGIQELVSKNSGSAAFQAVPNGLSQSKIGVKVKEEIGGDMNFIANAEFGFNPYSLRMADGPQSLLDNASTTASNLAPSANGDSSRAGQWDNSVGFAGLSSKTYGTLVVGRVNTLTLDGVNAYDPMGSAYAFSLIGNSGKTAGAGSTEDARSNTAVKYNISLPAGFRAAGLVQLGGFDNGNGSDGEWQGQIGADFAGLSVDAIYTKIKDQVNLGVGRTSPAPLLKATLSDNESTMVLAKYTIDKLKLFAGYETITYSAPSGTIPADISVQGGYDAYTSAGYTAGDLKFHVLWTGAKYALTKDVDLAVAYYHYIQDQGANALGQDCATANQATSWAKYCSGTENVVSAMVDYRPYKRFDIYGGVAYSKVEDGLAVGYLENQPGASGDAGIALKGLSADNFSVTSGLRVSF